MSESEKGRGRERERIPSSLDASAEPDAGLDEIMTWVETKSRALNRLSHPGAPILLQFKENAYCVASLSSAGSPPRGQKPEPPGLRSASAAALVARTGMGTQEVLSVCRMNERGNPRTQAPDLLEEERFHFLNFWKNQMDSSDLPSRNISSRIPSLETWVFLWPRGNSLGPDARGLLWTREGKSGRTRSFSK